MAGTLLQHLGGGPLGDVEETGDIRGDLRIEIVDRIVGKRFGDEDTRIVHQGIDPPEARQRFPDDTFGRFRITDVTGNCGDAIIAGLLDGPGGGNNAVVAVAVGFD
jgi:hypothetical protein